MHASDIGWAEPSPPLHTTHLYLPTVHQSEGVTIDGRTVLGGIGGGGGGGGGGGPFGPYDNSLAMSRQQVVEDVPPLKFPTNPQHMEPDML